MSNKSKAGSPNTGGKDPEEQSERVEEARPSDIPLTTETKELGGVRTATDDPCKTLTYAQYQEDMVTLVRLVEEAYFWTIAYPRGITVSSEELREQYLEVCPVLRRMLNRDAILETLDRWSVRPDRMRVTPLTGTVEMVFMVCLCLNGVLTS